LITQSVLPPAGHILNLTGNYCGTKAANCETVRTVHINDQSFTVLTFIDRTHSHHRGVPMARPNYSYEKRQKELARQKKQEEKRQRKLEKRNSADGSGDSGDSDSWIDTVREEADGSVDSSAGDSSGGDASGGGD